MISLALARRAAVAGVAALSVVTHLLAGDVRRLTLEEAVRLAMNQNRALKIARLAMQVSQHKKEGEHSGYFPSLTNQSKLVHISDLQDIVIPAGSLGTAGGTLIPAQGVNIQQGKQTLFLSDTLLSQPLTQLIRIHQQNRIAASEVAVSRDEVKKTENEVAVQVHSLYYGILVAGLQKKAAEQQTEYASENLRESENDVRKGSALEVVAIGSRADVLQDQQSVLTADLELDDLRTELNDLLGLPLDTRLELDPAVPTSFESTSKTDYLRIAWGENPEVLAAEEKVRKARAATLVARTAYIPDVTAFARQTYQNGVPFLVHNFGTFGFSFSYDVFDSGKRRSAIREQAAQLAEAIENAERLKDEVAVSIERTYNKLQRTKTMVEVARQVVALRTEGERLAGNQLAQGLVQISERKQAVAASYKAQADLLQASLAYLLARAELEQVVGRTPGV